MERKKNSDRTYLMHLGGITAPLGTYHLIDGVRIRINYRNCVPTCGRCYSTPEFCPGSGYARKCYEQGGQKLRLEDHIKWLAEEHIRRKAASENNTIEEINVEETPNPNQTQVIQNPPNLTQPKIPDLMSGNMYKVPNPNSKPEKIPETKNPETLEKDKERQNRVISERKGCE